MRRLRYHLIQVKTHFYFKETENKLLCPHSSTHSFLWVWSAMTPNEYTSLKLITSAQSPALSLFTSVSVEIVTDPRRDPGWPLTLKWRWPQLVEVSELLIVPSMPCGRPSDTWSCSEARAPGGPRRWACRHLAPPGETYTRLFPPSSGTQALLQHRYSDT